MAALHSFRLFGLTLRGTGELGRPRKKGKRLPTLQAIVDNPKTKWKTITIGNWYGEENRKIEIVSGKCVWYHSGKEAVPIRWVIIRDPSGKFETPSDFQHPNPSYAKANSGMVCQAVASGSDL